MQRRTLLKSALALPFLAAKAGAASASYKLALVSGGMRDGMLLAGLHVTLAPEWKTYWKMPGESGIPPQFDWSGSANLKSVNVEYPAPSRFTDASGDAIGYHDEVLMPLLVEPQVAGQPVSLRLALMIGVCRDICIPVRSELSLDMATAASDLRVAVWRQRVPQRAASAAENVVMSAQIRPQGAGKPVLALQVEGTPADIFVEQDDGAYFGRPAPGASPGEWLLTVSNVSDPGKLRGKPALVTVTYGDKAVEQPVILD